MDHKSRAASCQAKVRRESGFVKGDSSFNIHAGTVDCCLQSIIVSIYAGKLSRVTHGFVPIGVDSITAWTSNPRNSEESAKVDTWVYEGSSRHFSANSQLISDKGELLLELQGVHCVPYEAAVPLLFQQRQQELPYWRMRWMPDLRLNRISKALTIFSKPKIGDIVTLLCHNNASTKVLDIGGHYAPEVMENNAFIDFTVSASSDEELQSKKDALKNPMSVKVVKLEFLGGILASSPDTVYDMIIASKVILTSFEIFKSLLDYSQEASNANSYEPSLNYYFHTDFYWSLDHVVV